MECIHREELSIWQKTVAGKGRYQHAFRGKLGQGGKDTRRGSQVFEESFRYSVSVVFFCAVSWGREVESNGCF